MTDKMRKVISLEKSEDRDEILRLGAIELANGEMGIPMDVPLSKFSKWLSNHTKPAAPPIQSLASYLEKISASIRRNAPPVQEVKAVLGEYQISDSGVAYMWLHDGRSACRGMMRATRVNELVSSGEEIPHRDDEVLVSVSPEYSSQWGFRLIVSDIKIIGQGRSERFKGEDELKRRGVIDLNKTVFFPRRFGRVIVLAPDGAGLEDFNETTRLLETFGLLEVERRIATFEGPNAVRSLIEAISEISARNKPDRYHDALFMVRGGGAPSAIAWLNDIEVCEHLARLPIPLITGLGHERDNPLPEVVASRVFGTPSKAAHFLKEMAISLPLSALRSLETIRHVAETICSRTEEKLTGLQERILLASPERMMGKGWAIISDKDGNPVVNPNVGNEIFVTTSQGRMRVRIEGVKE
jgi:exodeoxyribonuclease VII large subunit